MSRTVGTRLLIVLMACGLGRASLIGVLPCRAADSTTIPGIDSSLYPDLWRLQPTTAEMSSKLNFSGTDTTKITTSTASKALAITPTDNFPLSSMDSPPPIINGSLKLENEHPEKLWSGNFDLGMDGTGGNSETFNIRFGFHAKRKTDQTILSLGADYLEQTSKSIATADRLFLEDRYEWLFEDSSWSCFLHNTLEYDRFQDYDSLDAGDIGLGYRFLKDGDTTLIGRFGGGYSHYYGGVNNGKYFPEGVFGLGLEQKFTKRVKFVGSIEYAVDMDDVNECRVRAQAAVEVLLDESMNLSTKLGVLERYKSLVTTAKPNDIDYAAVIIWKF